ncbi:nucleotidyltransferase family protein [Undibacterium sp. JH2W]|uniref:nucleotidyltransferase family protein n=1 Tax=Undibacterium sp. JH2W TaxID=3413037 RepID=UPI003BF27076
MTSPLRWTGILLAAGRGRRFDTSGQQDKLLQQLGNGCSVAQQSASNMLAAMSDEAADVVADVVAIVRPGHTVLTEQLQALGVACLACSDADMGMAHSLKHGLLATSDSAGWIIALADMPAVKTSTILLLVQALQAGAGIVVPVYQGRRGNPVGFARSYLPQLLNLEGDVGARRLLQTELVTQIVVDDAGIHQDLDTQDELVAHHARMSKLAS